MNVYYNPLDTKCKSIIGGIKQNEKLVIRIFSEVYCTCLFVLQKDGGMAEYKEMQRTAQGWEIALCLSDIGLYFYSFEIDGKRAGCGQFHELSFSEMFRPFQLLVTDAAFDTPAWFKGGIMYQIFPDRFFSCGNVTLEEGKWLHKSWNEMPEYRMNSEGKVLNNDFFGGNIQGIIAKLDHLESLKITALYLNPIFRAYSNHRYDTGDYMQIDPALGTEKDFADLIKECKRRGIRVILDGVFNHTGDDSLYFNKYGCYNSIGAYQSPASPYYSWYNFKHFPDQYDSWWGIDCLPAVNEAEPSYLEFITGQNGVLRHWMQYGLGGYRLDVADELPDEFIEKIRFAIKSENKDALVIGEVWEDASNKIAYGKRRKYFYGRELDSVMNYPLKDAIIHFVCTKDTAVLRDTIATLHDNYPKCVLDCLMNILGTHDTVRILTALGGIQAIDKEEMSRTIMDAQTRNTAIQRLKYATVLVFTLFGVPCIYYGDEIGMEGYSDPFCRLPFAWDNFDEEILSHYKRLAQLRSSLDVFKDGEYIELFSDKNCIIYERYDQDELIIVCINLGENKFTLKFEGTLYDLLEGGSYTENYTFKNMSYSILCNKPV